MKRKCRHPDIKLKREYEYVGHDCYAYSVECKCGLLITGWSSDETEKKLIAERSKK
jgi:hypothetical protein